MQRAHPKRDTSVSAIPVALRLGLDLDDVHDREPALRPTPFGIDVTRRLAAELGPYPRR